MPTKYDKNYNAVRGYTADKAKVDALRAKTAEIDAAKGRTAKAARPAAEPVADDEGQTTRKPGRTAKAAD